MAPTPRRTVVLLSARGTLRGLGPALNARGLRLRRVEAIRTEPCAPPGRGGWLPRRAVDTLVVTSRHAVGPALRAWARPRGRRTVPEVWAAGPGTAAQLRRLGFPRVRHGNGLGVQGIVRRLGPRARTVVHVRSDLAGDALARSLRARGHRVTEVIAYRVRLTTKEIRRLAPEIRGAGALVLTSPSVVESLGRAFGGTAVRTVGTSVPAIVLGERTARAAVAAGFRTVTLARTANPQRFASLVVRTVSDASN